MVNDVSTGLLLYGFIMGWLCVFDQFDSTACPRFDDYWPLFASYLRRLQHFILCRHHFVYANLIRWLSTGSKFRTHAGKCFIFTHVNKYLVYNDETLFDRKSMNIYDFTLFNSDFKYSATIHY